MCTRKIVFDLSREKQVFPVELLWKLSQLSDLKGNVRTIQTVALENFFADTNTLNCSTVTSGANSYERRV